jgi:hypothetical protein
MRRWLGNLVVQPSGSTFLAMLQGLSSTAARANKASDREVERYQEHVVSAKFVAWREEQEAQRMAVAP